MLNIGLAISLFRRNRQIKQKELAKMVGVSTNYMSLIENNRRIPSLRLLEKIAHVLKIELSSLLYFSEMFGNGEHSNG